MRRNFYFLYLLLIALLAGCVFFYISLMDFLKELETRNRSNGFSESRIDSSLPEEEKCELGDSNSCWRLGTAAWYNGKQEQARRYADKACDRYNSLGCKLLVEILTSTSSQDFEKDDDIHHAMKKGCPIYGDGRAYPVLCEALGDWHLKRRDLSRAKRYYAQTSFNDIYKGRADLKLGMIFEAEGRTDFPCILYFRSCRDGHEDGCIKLSSCELVDGLARVRGNISRGNRTTDQTLAKTGSLVLELMTNTSVSENESSIQSGRYNKELSLRSYFSRGLFQLARFEEQSGDMARALTIYGDACDLGQGEEQRLACLRSVSRIGVKEYLIKNETRLKRQCEDGETVSCMKLAFFYEEVGRLVEAASYYKSLCRPKDQTQQFCWEYYKVATRANLKDEAKAMRDELCKANPGHRC